jgi:hypothetical protein
MVMRRNKSVKSKKWDERPCWEVWVLSFVSLRLPGFGTNGSALEPIVPRIIV